MNDYLRELRRLVGRRCILLPGVRAIIPNEVGDVLLQRRTDMPLWGLPAGAVELGESALEAIKREVAEETALTVLEAEPMGLYSGPTQQFAYPNGDQIQCFSLAFIIRRWEGQPRADGVEGSRLQFFSPSQLPADLLPIHRKTLKDYTEYDGGFLLG
jgi:ADP-ribose pyrophosphatase YjhB (NUDIX family)